MGYKESGLSMGAVSMRVTFIEVFFGALLCPLFTTFMLCAVAGWVLTVIGCFGTSLVACLHEMASLGLGTQC
jgi:hypothetical protein